jgi:hypothetical protein
LLDGVVGSDFSQRIYADFKAFQLLVHARFFSGSAGFCLGLVGFLAMMDR